MKKPTKDFNSPDIDKMKNNEDGEYKQKKKLYNADILVSNADKEMDGEKLIK